MVSIGANFFRFQCITSFVVTEPILGAQIPTRKSSESGIGGIAFEMILNISYDAGKLERG